MTILITVNGRFLSQPMTGVQRYAANIAQSLDELVADDPAFSSVELVIYCDRAIKTKPKYLKARLSISRRARGYLWEQFVLPFLPSHAMLSLGNMGPIWTRRQIVVFHDTNVIDLASSYSFAYKSAYRILQPILALRCSVVATVSNYSWQKLVSHRLVKSDTRPFIAGNGHEHIKAWHPNSDGLRVDFDRKFVLMVGSYAKHKNFDSVLGAAEQLDQIGVDIIVAGSPGAIFNEIDSKTISRNIKFVGRISDNALCWLYRNALVLAIPSVQEGFGLPALEAMALGCPVVSSRGGSLPEVCGDAAVYVDALDVNGWGQALVSLIQDNTRRSLLIERGFIRCNQFRWADSARKLLECAVATAKRSTRALSR